ncbi:DNA replication/repair protein RecF [Pisciglobus halotolerans]|uniref:DNA replication and repair protein RecF n=1 Tax=Pisciglobus halotolerans TaxID=745365 RepID=A0A1I3D5E3_9LACT|nr:DNA replication/repair protein RecF [Pisciglobus halotolerans]SFH81808.1 DNA replication and repair protein RecF [Pisciglobus halotolerans]
MFIQQLELTHFRNYEKAEVAFSKGINVFLGENAQGKTNLMEAIYVLAMARSHRTANDKELIQWNEEFARISGRVQKKHSSFPLDITISRKGKKAKFNHLEQKKLSAYIGNLNVILFAPEDLSLVKGAPNVRRKFIDMELGQISPVYLHHLVEYQHILKQRNQYLKQLAMRKATDLTFLEVLTEQLAISGAAVLKERFSFAKQLETWAQPIHQEISKQREELMIDYACSIVLTDPEDKEAIYTDLLNVYQDNQKRELDQGTTIAGPHRDDLKFFVNEKNVQTYGSQGQQRTTALSIKLAEISLMHELTGEYPVLLLDDVLSELDDNRQTHLLTAIQNKVQTFLTTTSLDGVKKNLLDAPKVFNIDQGNIETESE